MIKISDRSEKMLPLVVIALRFFFIDHVYANSGGTGPVAADPDGMARMLLWQLGHLRPAHTVVHASA